MTNLSASPATTAGLVDNETRANSMQPDLNDAAIDGPVSPRREDLR
jgi:hypothetical protein